jgi:PHD/YefM family antitoxin component YafN of YafNO toxin-antitoxin module
MTSVYTPTSARKNLYSIIKYVNSQQEPVEIVPANGTAGAVILAADFWHSLQETLYLEQTGILADVKRREADDSGFTDVDDIDWDKL